MQYLIANFSYPYEICAKGMSVHHMLKENGIDHLAYEERLLGSLDGLQNLIRRHGTKVVWMKQPPTGEFFGPNGHYNTMIHARKIEQYNLIASRVFSY